jgi:hypothetical protein
MDPFLYNTSPTLSSSLLAIAPLSLRIYPFIYNLSNYPAQNLLIYLFIATQLFLCILIVALK